MSQLPGSRASLPGGSQMIVMSSTRKCCSLDLLAAGEPVTQTRCVAHLPDLRNADDHEGDPAGRRVRVRLRVTPQGLQIIGDAVRAAEIEALLQQLEPAMIERMLCG
jgi:hypothetical protein